MSTITNGYISSYTSTSVTIYLEWNTANDPSGVYYYFRIHLQGYQTGTSRYYSGALTSSIYLTIPGVNGNQITADCYVGLGAESYGGRYRVSNETMYTAIDERFPSYYPKVKDQWVWGAGDGPDANGWQSQVGNCVPQAIATIKEIHEFRERGTTNYYSTGWVFGNRLPTDDQGTDFMNIAQALDRLVADGVPVYSILPENDGTNFPNPTWYPDNYFLNDWVDGGRTIIGAKTLVANNKARQNVVDNAKAAKISSYYSIPYIQNNISSIKQAIINNGCVMIHISIADNFDFFGGTGCNGVLPIPDRWRNLNDYHTAVITGWKVVGGKPYWIVHNNWGDWYWGDENRRGYAYVPFDYTFTIQVFVLVDSNSSPPQGTTGISATATSGHTFYVAWNTIAGATGYYLYKSSDDGLNYYPWMGSGQSADVGNVTSKSGVPIDYEWQNYRFQVTPYNANGNGSNNYSSSYKSLDETTPSVTAFYTTQIQPTQITVNITGHDNNPASGTPSGIYRYAMYRGGSFVGYATVNGPANNTDQSAYYTFTGLVAATTYTLEARAEDYSGNVSGSWTITPTTSDSRPGNWNWTTAQSNGAKIAGNYSMLAQEWNDFTLRINAFRTWWDGAKGTAIGQYSFTTAASGNAFQAFMFNQARSAIAAMGTTYLPSTVSSGNPITVAGLNGLRDALNVLA